MQKQLVSIEFTKFIILLEKKIEKNYFFSRIYNFYQFFRRKLIKQGWRHLRMKHCAPTFAHACLRIHICERNILCMHKCRQPIKQAFIVKFYIMN